MLLTHYTSYERRKRRKDGTKETKPPTLVEGGCMKRTEQNAGKDGHGFCLVAGVTQTGLPLMARLTPIDNKEAEHATAMLESDWPGVDRESSQRNAEDRDKARFKVRHVRHLPRRLRHLPRRLRPHLRRADVPERARARPLRTSTQLTHARLRCRVRHGIVMASDLFVMKASHGWWNTQVVLIPR